MHLKQFYLGCLSHASYLVGDESSKSAAVVDPQRDVEQYIEEAAAKGLAIRHVLLTHFHADFVSGHLELQRKTGASIHLGAAAKAEFPFEPMKDGAALQMGAVTFRFLATPGHTPESTCIVVHDGGQDRAVFTGDTLFVGDVGRPDLMASEGVTDRELAGFLYDSLRGKLLPLADATLVYPAHGAGSLCGKSMGPELFSTIGQQRKFNRALAPMSKEEFVRLAVADLPEAPPYFRRGARLNRSRRATLEETLARELRPLPQGEVLRLAASGAQLLDTRDPDAFAAGHLAGSVNVGLGGKYATWAGTVLDAEAPIVLVAEPGRERESALRLGRIGLDNVAGYLEGGAAALGERARRVERIDAAELARRLKESRPPTVLDVRATGERRAARIEPSVHVPLNRLPAELDRVPAGPLAVHCAGGYRSSIAASLLRRAGRADVCDLIGGMAAWEEAGLPAARG